MFSGAYDSIISPYISPLLLTLCSAPPLRTSPFAPFLAPTPTRDQPMSSRACSRPTHPRTQPPGPVFSCRCSCSICRCTCLRRSSSRCSTRLWCTSSPLSSSRQPRHQVSRRCGLFVTSCIAGIIPASGPTRITPHLTPAHLRPWPLASGPRPRAPRRLSSSGVHDHGSRAFLRLPE